MKIHNMFALRTSIAVVALTAAMQLPASSALIAEWNFDTGTSADLTASIGGYTFGLVPGGNDPVHNPGTLSLDQFTELVATGINSTELPELQSNATIFTRMRFDSALTATGFFFGLVNDTQAADFAQMTMTAFEFDTPSRALAAFGHTNTLNENTNTPNELFAGTATIPPTGQYFNLAIVVTAGVNAIGDPSPTDTQLRLNLDGVEVAVANGGTALQAFQALALGQLKASGGVAAMTFDTVKLYDTSLTALEIGAIPEPGSAALAGVGCIMLGLARRRTVRAL
jgi:hypothetical protein